MHLAGDGGIVGAGFVEADVAGAANAENLEVDAAAVLDFLFVGGAVGGNLVTLHRAGGQVDVLRLHVDVVEEIGVHEVPVGFRMVVVQAAVFVQIEGDDVGKGKAFFLVQADQLRIKGQRSGARGEAKNHVPAFGGARADQFRNFSCQSLGSILGSFKSFYFHNAPHFTSFPGIFNRNSPGMMRIGSLVRKIPGNGSLHPSRCGK